MNQNIAIAGRHIGQGYPPYVIAELSANHNGDLAQALRVIDAAVAAGADALKIQTYTPDTMTIDSDLPDFQIKEGLWNGRALYELYQQAHTPWDWHATLFAHAKKRGITIFSTPFDTTAADLLDELGAPAFKIASFEATDLPLIHYVAKKGKPMIISTGMANREEIAEAVMAARKGGCEELVLLHCVSGYPAPASDYNLATMVDIAQHFGVQVGLSDHTLNNTSAIAATALGACVIEKHFTLDRNGGGPDDSFSLEPEELQQLCQGVLMAWQALGCVDYGLKSSEKQNVIFRRSIYAVQKISKGTVITKDHVRSIRPGYGLPPKYLDQVIGSRAKEDIQKATPITWDKITNQMP